MKVVGSKTASESFYIEALQKSSWSSFLKSGKITDEQLAENKSAIAAFVNSGASYRMTGRTEYGRSSGNRFFEFWAEVDMSYNSEIDVYKFKLSHVVLFNDEGRLDSLFSAVENGVYYIVKEDGKTYVLSEINEVKTVTDISQDRSVYNFLMSLRMAPSINLNFLDDEKAQRGGKNDDAAYQLYDSSYTQKTFISKYFNKNQMELRTYKNMPVSCYYASHKDANFDLDRRYKFNFYYNKIPNDNPSVAEWE